MRKAKWNTPIKTSIHLNQGCFAQSLTYLINSSNFYCCFSQFLRSLTRSPITRMDFLLLHMLNINLTLEDSLFQRSTQSFPKACLYHMLIKVKETCKCPKIRPWLPLYFPPLLGLSRSHTWQIFITLAIPSLLMNALVWSPFMYKEPHEVAESAFLLGGSQGHY